MNTPKNTIEFRVWGKLALFSEPVTRMGGEKCTYHLPTYESLKGVLKSVYWKPTIVWVVDRVRVMNRVRTRTRGVKPVQLNNEQNLLSMYTYLTDVSYQVSAHFEWNEHRPEFRQDRNDGKHYDSSLRWLERGGRQDVFLGTRDCQADVEPCTFGSGEGHYDGDEELSYGLMFHGFDYPDETGKEEMWARFWRPVMRRGVVEFVRPEQCEVRKFLRGARSKTFEQKSEGSEYGIL